MRSSSTPGSSCASARAIARRRVGARVVGDDDPPGERAARRPGSGAAGARCARATGLLVEDRHDDLDARGPWPGGRAPAGRRAGERLLGHGHSVGARPWDHGGRRAERRLGVGAQAAAGRVTTKLAPPSGALPARTSPPCASTIAGDDRQPQARAAAAALAPALGAPEALEQRLGVAGRQARAVVADLEAHVVARALELTSIGVPARRVDERVAQQVAEHLAQLVAVADDLGGAVDLQLDLAARRGRAPVVDRVAASAARSTLGVRRVGAPRRAGPASAGPRPARPSAPPRPRCAASPSRRRRARARRPCGTARRSRGSRPAACAARARRRR